MTYLLGSSGDGRKYIQCLRCGLKSWHPQDVEQRFCVLCDRFHEDPDCHAEIAVIEIVGRTRPAGAPSDGER